MTKEISWCVAILANDISDIEWLSTKLFDIGATGIEETAGELLVYFSSESSELSIIKEMLEMEKLTFSITVEEDKNWNQIWEENFEPVYIKNIAEIRASFHSSKPGFAYTILIDPKMSFGTGHHPTTAQVIEHMFFLDFKHASVLDIGSGTGILAILAEKMGAMSIVALDNDPWCYDNCIENIELNDATHVVPILGEKLPMDNKYDILVANINRNYHLEYMTQLAQILNYEGYMLLSGFLTEDVKLILALALELHLIATYYTEQNNWVCITIKKITV